MLALLLLRDSWLTGLSELRVVDDTHTSPHRSSKFVPHTRKSLSTETQQ